MLLKIINFFFLIEEGIHPYLVDTVLRISEHKMISLEKI